MRYAEFTSGGGRTLYARVEDGKVRLSLDDTMDHTSWEIDTAAFLKLIAGDLPRLTDHRVVLALEGEESFILGTALEHARREHNRLQISAGSLDGLIARVRRAMEVPVSPIVPSEFDRQYPQTLADGATHLSGRLFRLIAGIDVRQREVLRTVYPEHVELYERWYAGTGGEVKPFG